MEDELREKIYEMHGTVQRLDQKTDNVLERQGKFDERIERNSEKINEVDSKAQNNKKKIYAASLAGSILLTLASIAATIGIGFP